MGVGGEEVKVEMKVFFEKRERSIVKKIFIVLMEFKDRYVSCRQLEKDRIVEFEFDLVGIERRKCFFVVLLFIRFLVYLLFFGIGCVRFQLFCSLE